MASAIPDLWPEDVATDVVTPLVIMRHQAGLLRLRTKNILEADVMSSESGTESIVHDFQIVVPALNRYRVSLFSVEHGRLMPYPVTVRADGVFSHPSLSFINRSDTADATTQSQFTELLKQVFESPSVRSVIHSMIALVKEANLGSASRESTPA